MASIKGVAWRLARIQALPARDRWRLVLAGVGLPASDIGVRVFGLRGWMKCVERAIRRRSVARPEGDDLRLARETERVVSIAARHAPYRGNCLSRSLTLWWLLLGQGIQSDLRIGVTRPPAQFEAHAWIEYQGVVINDRLDVGRQYSMFDRPIHSGTRFV